MKKKTMGQLFAQIRIGNYLTMREIANKCDISESVVWKVEHDWPVRWETVHLVLTVALNVISGSEKYQAMHLLWLKSRQEAVESRPDQCGKKSLSKHGVEATRKFRILIHDLDPVQTKKVLAAATRAARSLS